MGFLRRLRGSPPPAALGPSPAAEPPLRHSGPITDWSLAALNNKIHSAATADATTGSTVSVVGEASYQGTLEAAGGGRTVDGVRERDHQAVLVPEPDNKYDPNAVSVVILPYGVIGYLKRADAVAYRPVIDRLAERGMLTACLASLSGGWDRDGDRGYIGVRLHMAKPKALLAEVDQALESDAGT